MKYLRFRAIVAISLLGLGGVGGQLQEKGICDGFGGAAVVESRVFVPCTSGVREIKVAADGKITQGWQAPSDINGSPIVGGQTVYVLGPERHPVCPQ